MASGVKVDDTVKDIYQQIKSKSKNTQKLKFGVFKFSDDLKKIECEKTATPDECCEQSMDYDTLISSLPADDVRYVVYDFDFVNKDGTKTSELILVSWHPEKSPIKKKMICASSLGALKSALSVSKNVLEGDSLAELDSKAAVEKVGGKCAA